jgi:hypothetical protein
VVFPQPEGPNREKNSPFFISRLTFLSATKLSKDLETPPMTTSLPFNLFLPASSVGAMAPGRTARHTHAAHFVGGICRFNGRYLIYKSTMGIFFGVVNWFLGEIFEK